MWSASQQTAFLLHLVTTWHSGRNRTSVIETRPLVHRFDNSAALSLDLSLLEIFQLTEYVVHSVIWPANYTRKLSRCRIACVKTPDILQVPANNTTDASLILKTSPGAVLASSVAVASCAWVAALSGYPPLIAEDMYTGIPGAQNGS